MAEYRQNVSYKQIMKEEGGDSQEEKHSSGNTGLPFGLCKKYRIPLPDDATPRDAWAALEGKTGLKPDQVYEHLASGKELPQKMPTEEASGGQRAAQKGDEDRSRAEGAQIPEGYEQEYVSLESVYHYEDDPKSPIKKQVNERIPILLPKLEGSEKQIAWAKEIRAVAINRNIQEAMRKYRTAEFNDQIARIRGEGENSWLAALRSRFNINNQQDYEKFLYQQMQSEEGQKRLWFMSKSAANIIDNRYRR